MGGNIFAKHFGRSNLPDHDKLCGGTNWKLFINLFNNLVVGVYSGSDVGSTKLALKFLSLYVRPSDWIRKNSAREGMKSGKEQKQ